VARSLAAALATALVAALAACASAGAPPPSDGALGAPGAFGPRGSAARGAARRDRTIPDSRVITAEELGTQSPALPLDVAVQHLRPTFAWRRGRSPTVFVDGLRYGAYDSLRDLPTSWVVRIELLDGPTATWRYGTAHSGVVLDVTTIRALPPRD
jgi:hypothetical protein